MSLYNDNGDDKITFIANNTTGKITVSHEINSNTEMNSPVFFNDSAQNNSANACTRKDYVDGLVSAKQNTLTAGTGIDITSNTISVD